MAKNIAQTTNRQGAVAEALPDRAHRIGKLLARRIFAKRYGINQLSAGRKRKSVFAHADWKKSAPTPRQ